MSKLANKMYFKMLGAKRRALKALKKENGEANIIAIVLILAIVIALAIIFRKQIMNLFDTVWGALFDDVEEVIQ